MTGLPLTTLLFWTIAALMTGAVALLVARPLSASDRRMGMVVTLAVPAIALPVYLLLGHPELTAWRTRPQIPPFLHASIEALKQATAAHPDDAASWVLLGDVDLKIQHYAEAETAYRTALKADPADPRIAVALAETLVRGAGGSVTQDALALFGAHAEQPVSRYYIAMAKSQAADWDGALADWEALAKSAAPHDVWLEVTQDRIVEARRVLGLDRDH